MAYYVGFGYLSNDIIVAPNVVADVQNGGEIRRELVKSEQDESLGPEIEENRVPKVEFPRRNMNEHVAYDAGERLRYEEPSEQLLIGP